MTPSSRPDQSSRPAPHRRGFTLVELLVVMGIILVLISILLPAVNRAHLQAVRHSMTADMAIISQALDAYRNDFGDYPRTGMGAFVSGPGTLGAPVQVTGAAVLCWALAGPGPAMQDGAGMMTGSVPVAPASDLGAPGFRPHVSGQGRVYGPYINLDQFRIGNITPGSNAPPNNSVTPPGPNGPVQWYDDATCVLADRYGNIILYFPGNTNVSPVPTSSSSGSTPGLLGSWTVGTTQTPNQIATSGLYGVYNYQDNSTPVNAGVVKYPAYISASPVNVGQSTLTPKVMAYRLGHTSAFTGTAIAPMTAGEVPVVVPYLLWSAGPDGQFGPQVNTSGVTTGEDDDVVYPTDQLLDVPAGQTP